MRPVTRLAKVVSNKRGRTTARPAPLTNPMQLAILKSINGDGTLAVSFDAVTTVNIQMLGTFSPQVGQVLMCIVFDTQVYALGPTAGATGSAASATIPPGVIWDYGGTGTPDVGWLLCDGTAYSRVTYAPLFAAIGTAHGSGDGSTTFNVPDSRGRSTIGVGSVGTNSQPTIALGGTGGEGSHTLSTGEMPSHAHTDSGHSHASVSGYEPVVQTSSTKGLATPGDGAAAYAVGATTTTDAANIQNTGGGGGHNNLHPYFGVTKIIKV
jgi:microcystin-dependent protein